MLFYLYVRVVTIVFSEFFVDFIVSLPLYINFYLVHIFVYPSVFLKNLIFTAFIFT